MEMNEIKFKVGETVLIPKQLTICNEPKTGVVTQFYPKFFNVRYPEGYEQSISYFDANKMGVI